jgi:hypothetical protein
MERAPFAFGGHAKAKCKHRILLLFLFGYENITYAGGGVYEDFVRLAFSIKIVDTTVIMPIGPIRGELLLEIL